ncbi:hypothetical protein V8E36_008760 [Tilletia maclaganii]
MMTTMRMMSWTARKVFSGVGGGLPLRGPGLFRLGLGLGSVRCHCWTKVLQTARTSSAQPVNSKTTFKKATSGPGLSLGALKPEAEKTTVTEKWIVIGTPLTPPLSISDLVGQPPAAATREMQLRALMAEVRRLKASNDELGAEVERLKEENAELKKARAGTGNGGGSSSSSNPGAGGGAGGPNGLVSTSQ